MEHRALWHNHAGLLADVCRCRSVDDSLVVGHDGSFTPSKVFRIGPHLLVYLRASLLSIFVINITAPSKVTLFLPLNLNLI